MLTGPDIIDALKVCYDPELRINIVDMGRIASIHTESDTDAPGQRTRVTVALLTRTEHDQEQHDSMLAAQITNRLLGLPEVSHAEVKLLNNQHWTPERMTPAARKQLGQQRGLIQLG